MPSSLLSCLLLFACSPDTTHSTQSAHSPICGYPAASPCAHAPAARLDSSPSIHPLARRRESLGGNRDGRHCGKGMWARVSLFSVRARALSLCGTRCSSAVLPWICYHVHVRIETTLFGSGAPPPCRVLPLPVTVSPRDHATYSLLCRADQPTTTTTTTHLRVTCCARPTTHSMVLLMPLI
jgi:hypothetical protein